MVSGSNCGAGSFLLAMVRLEGLEDDLQRRASLSVPSRYFVPLGMLLLSSFLPLLPFGWGRSDLASDSSSIVVSIWFFVQMFCCWASERTHSAAVIYEPESGRVPQRQLKQLFKPLSLLVSMRFALIGSLKHFKTQKEAHTKRSAASTSVLPHSHPTDSRKSNNDSLNEGSFLPISISPSSDASPPLGAIQAPTLVFYLQTMLKVVPNATIHSISIIFSPTLSSILQQLFGIQLDAHLDEVLIGFLAGLSYGIYDRLKQKSLWRSVGREKNRKEKMREIFSDTHHGSIHARKSIP